MAFDQVYERGALASPWQDGVRGWLGRRYAAVGAVLRTGGLSAFPAILVIWMMIPPLRVHAVALDFRLAFSPAANAVLHGLSPYPPTNDWQLHHGMAFVYPPAAALLMTPLAVLPATLGEVLWTLILAGCAFGVLWVLGVRDWRCYGAMALGFPFYNGVQSGNISLLLALGVALAWRYRDKRIAVALLIALAASVKLFLWPLFAWLLVTRWRSALLAGAAAGVISLGSWAIVGFGQIPLFLKDVSIINHVQSWRAYTPSSLLLSAGVPEGAAHLIGMAVGVAALGSVFLVARGRDGDRRAFTMAIAACLLLSPIVWAHYFALLWIPLAIARPRYSLIWSSLFLMWFCAQPPVDPMTIQYALGLGIFAAVIYSSLRIEPWVGRARMRLAGALSPP